MTLARKKKPGPQKTGRGSQRFPRNLRNLSGSPGRFCRTFHIVKTLLKKGSAEPLGTLGSKPSFSGPANSSPRKKQTQRPGVKSQFTPRVSAAEAFPVDFSISKESTASNLRGLAAILFISRNACSGSIAKLLRACFCGGLLQLSRDTLQNGVSHRMCLCATMYQGGDIAPFWGSANLKYRATWEIAAIASQNREGTPNVLTNCRQIQESCLAGGSWSTVGPLASALQEGPKPYSCLPNQQRGSPSWKQSTIGGADSMVMKFHGNARGKVRVNFLPLLVSQPIFSCVAPSLCSGIVRVNVRLNIAIPSLSWNKALLEGKPTVQLNRTLGFPEIVKEKGYQENNLPVGCA